MYNKVKLNETHLTKIKTLNFKEEMYYEKEETLSSRTVCGNGSVSDRVREQRRQRKQFRQRGKVPA